ncbi:MAG: hypothetical protein R3330_01155 [Saprospiraceae bacterium]|nr:hypothetical protein [Saprospiraceae bacterium]
MVRRLLQPTLAFCLLGIYLSAVVVTEVHVTHEHTHAPNEVCSDQAERNPCHRAIYHHDTKRGCQHPGHLSEARQDCDLCDAICGFQPLLADAHDPGDTVPIADQDNHYFAQYLNHDCSCHQPVRGPPAT